MSKALAWIRKSRGKDGDVGLEEQREVVPTPAVELADKVETHELGVHTGFSTMTRDDDTGLLDRSERVIESVQKLQVVAAIFLSRSTTGVCAVTSTCE